MFNRSPIRAVLLVVLLVLLGAGVVSVGPSSASPQPTPICPNCGVQFEHAAAEHGYDVTVTQSVVDVHAQADGSARWSTRTTLTESGAANLTTSAARDVVATRIDAHPLGTPHGVDVALEDRTLVVTYTLDDVATSRTGVVLVDAFYRGDDAWWIVNADWFAVHAPDSHRLANDLAADTNATAVTYHGSSQDRYGGDSIASDTFVAFTPRGTTLPDARADIAIATYLLPIVLSDLFRFGTVPALILAAALLLYPRLDVEAADPGVDPDRLVAISIGVIATLIGLPLAFGTVWFGTDVTTTVLAAGFGLLATTLALRYPDTATLRSTIEGATAGLLAFAASNVIVIALTTDLPVQRALSPTIFAILLALPLVTMLPLGYAVATQSRYARHLRVLIVAAPLILLVTRLPIQGGGLASFFFLLLPIALSLTIAVIGLLPYWLGSRLAAASPDAR